MKIQTSFLWRSHRRCLALRPFIFLFYSDDTDRGAKKKRDKKRAKKKKLKEKKRKEKEKVRGSNISWTLDSADAKSIEVGNLYKHMKKYAKNAVLHDVAGNGDCLFLAFYVALCCFFSAPFVGHLQAVPAMRWLSAEWILLNGKDGNLGIDCFPGFLRGFAEETLLLSHRFHRGKRGWREIGPNTAYADGGYEGIVMAKKLGCNVKLLQVDDKDIFEILIGDQPEGVVDAYIFCTGLHYMPIFVGDTDAGRVDHFRAIFATEIARFNTSKRSFLFRNVIPVDPTYQYHKYADDGKSSPKIHADLHAREEVAFANIIMSAKAFLFGITKGGDTSDAEVIASLRAML